MNYWHTRDEEPIPDSKVEVHYIGENDVHSEGVGYYMFCGSSYVFNIGGFAIESARVLSWRYCNV